MTHARTRSFRCYERVRERDGERERERDGERERERERQRVSEREKGGRLRGMQGGSNGLLFCSVQLDSFGVHLLDRGERQRKMERERGRTEILAGLLYLLACCGFCAFGVQAGAAVD